MIVGAGAAGLCALHAMQRAGFDAVALEQHGEVGGVWATTRYPSLTMHSRSFSYRFHDFPPIASRGDRATGPEVRAYLASFARAKGIADRIEHGQRVDRIVHRPGRARGRCLVIATDVATGAVRERACDVVVCATGYSNAGRPHVPALPGRETSRVRVLHSGEVSQEVVDDIRANRRRVVVLGAGRSAHEILSLFEGTASLADLTWVYVKSLWSTSYEKLYSDPLREPWNAALYLYYMGVQVARRRLGWGRAMRLLQAPLVRTGYLVNPLEPDSDVCRNRGAIMKADQLAFLRTVRSVRAAVIGLGERAVLLEVGRALDADYLICATGYDRRADLPALAVERADGSRVERPLTGEHGLYLHLIVPSVPEVSVLSAAILYPQHLLGFSLAAVWLARFHQGRLRPQPTTAAMERWLERRARELGPWCSDEYLSGGVPYAHQRDKDVLPVLFAQLGIDPGLARALTLRGTDERAFAAVCERVARALA